MDDHDRPLNERGKRDAPIMAKAVADSGFRPQRIVSSTALRARATATVFAEVLGGEDGDVHLTEELYLASAATIISCARQLDEGIESAMFFGHNPGMHETCNLLLPRPKIVDMATCAVAHFSLDFDHWGEIQEGYGELVSFLYPKGLGV